MDAVKYHVSEDVPEIDYPDVLVSTGKMAMVLIEQGSQLTNRNTTGVTNDTHATIDNYIVHPLLDTEILTEPDDADTVQAV